jgi:hypothetical protein
MTNSETTTPTALDCPSWCVANHGSDAARRQESEQRERAHFGYVERLCGPEDEGDAPAGVEVVRIDDLATGTAGTVGVSAFSEGVLSADQAAAYAAMLRRAQTIAAAANRGDLACPPWCVEHYTGEDGGSNHASFPRAVTGVGTYSSDPIIVSTWAERRDMPDGASEAVGIIERKLSGTRNEDVQLTAAQMTELLGHLAAVVVEVEQAR